ncbi:MAG: hypothetical protein LBG59_05925 [Candidatus Peribacteria bacterium]|nr:hypothetical protein [Candidatus Peribacteria bacterium]
MAFQMPHLSRLALRAFLLLGDGSLLMSRPGAVLSRSLSASCMLFQPGAAQRSRTMSPGWMLSTCAANPAAISWT